LTSLLIDDAGREPIPLNDQVVHLAHRRPMSGCAAFFCDSIADFEKGFNPNTKEILADIENYTDLNSVLQISEVTVEHS
jgi:uncharacterized protein (TIGR02118 family)